MDVAYEWKRERMLPDILSLGVAVESLKGSIKIFMKIKNGKLLGHCV